MTSKVIIRRLATGVPGLDQVLGGGLPEFSFNLIAGPPGSGKTTFAHQLMFALAKPDQRALYFTVLGEPAVKMLRYQQQFDFYDTEAIGGAVNFVNIGDVVLGGSLDQVLSFIAAQTRALSPAFVFVDSFRSISSIGGGDMQERDTLQRFVENLGMLMASWQATTFLIGEYPPESDVNPVFTVADGLIWLRQSVQRNSMVRKIEVSKMRGQPTLPGLHTFRISNAGIRIFAPALQPAQPNSGARPEADRDQRLSTGMRELDAMLGGGVPRGYSILVAGPSGSGKSILAAAFLAEGTRLGETGVIAAFEQRAERSRSPVLVTLIAQGLVGVVDSRAPDLSIEEVVLLLADEVRRLGAKRVVIDSLSGFELALAPSFRPDFRESLALMVTALAGLGVTVLMTSELEDRYTDLRFSPYGTAFLTDAIIVQRYIEVDNRLLRVMAVVKVRASAHSNQLREYTIDDQGIHVGQPIKDQIGLLTGRSTHEPLLASAGNAV